MSLDAADLYEGYTPPQNDYSQIRAVPSTSTFGMAYEKTIVPQLLPYLKAKGSFVLLAVRFHERWGGTVVDTPAILIGVNNPTALGTEPEKRRLEAMCRGDAWPQPIIAIFDLRDSEEVESAADPRYSAMKDIEEPLESYYGPLSRFFVLVDEQLPHEKIPLGASIGFLPKDKGGGSTSSGGGSTSSHGMFAKGGSEIYGISTAHGFGTTKSKPEIDGAAIISPSSNDLSRTEEVLLFVKRGFEEKAASWRKLALASPYDYELVYQRDLSKRRLEQISKLERDITWLRGDEKRAQFATLHLARKVATQASNPDGTERPGELRELLDYTLYKVTKTSRITGNFTLTRPERNSLGFGQLCLDANVQMNSRTLGPTQGIVSGIALYQYVEADKSKVGSKDNNEKPDKDTSGNDRSEFEGLTFRHYFVMVDPMTVDASLKEGDSVLLSAPGSSGAVWRNNSQHQAVALHRGHRVIPIPTLTMDTETRKKLLDAVKLKRGKRDTADEGEIVEFPKWDGKHTCEIAMVTNIQAILRDLRHNDEKKIHLERML